MSKTPDHGGRYSPETAVQPVGLVGGILFVAEKVARVRESARAAAELPFQVGLGLAAIAQLQLRTGNGNGPDGMTTKQYKILSPEDQAAADEAMAKEYVKAAADARRNGDDEHSDALSNTARLFFRRR